MAKRSLTEREQKLLNRQAELDRLAAKLKLDQKRERMRRLIEMGEMVEKAGLAELPPAQLYAALRTLAAEGSLLRFAAASSSSIPIAA